MSKSINTTGEFYFGVSEEKSTGVYTISYRTRRSWEESYGDEGIRIKESLQKVYEKEKSFN